MRSALYARYSSDRQNERSIEDQLAVGRRHAEARGWTVVATFSDAAISGAAMANRPGLLSLLASAEAGGFDLVLVEDEDRLARNLEHLAHVTNRLRHAGVQVATLASDAIGILEVGLKGVMAELYLVNLGQKTRRGMRANAEAGKATGSRLYGYRSEPGGAQAIVEAEAEVIRRIFRDYVAGATGRDIAVALNREGVPSPRGRAWNAATITGSRNRGNGILHSDLYRGVKTWNRLEVRKDPTTGKRRPIVRPRSEWRETPVPHLAIVDPAVFAQAAARLGAHTPASAGVQRKPGIFAGLLKCGICGGSYTSYTGGRLICAAHRERGTCSNTRTITRAEVERRVLDGLKARLLAPEAVAAYVRAYHAAWAELAREKSNARAPLQAQIARQERQLERLIDAVADGTASAAMRARIVSTEAELEAARAELAGMEAPAAPPVTLHPRAAERYAALVETLQENLAAWSANPDAGEAARGAIAAVRALVDRIVLTPESAERAAPVAITLHGDLARFLVPGGAANDPGCGGRLVAGGGLEPPTCGL